MSKNFSNSATLAVKPGLGVSKKKWNLVDGNLSNYGKEFPPNTPVGAKGTLPGAETKSDFQTRLRAVDPKPRDFSYAPESYDAAVTISLAAIAAKSDAGKAIATKLVEVSKGGTKCSTFARLPEAARAGAGHRLRRCQRPIEFSDQGDPTEATIGIYQYGADNIYKNLEFRAGKI